MYIASYVDVHTCAYGLMIVCTAHVQAECLLFAILSHADPTTNSCDDEVTSLSPSTSTATSGSAIITGSSDPPAEPTVEPSIMPAPTAEPPSKVVGVHVTPGVQNTSPTLTVAWQAVAGGAVNYAVKYSAQPGEVNIPPEGALEVKGISGTSTILTALERGTTYYIWVVGVSEGGEGPHSDRLSSVTYNSEWAPIVHHAYKLKSTHVSTCECLKPQEHNYHKTIMKRPHYCSTRHVACWTCFEAIVGLGLSSAGRLMYDSLSSSGYWLLLVHLTSIWVTCLVLVVFSQDLKLCWYSYAVWVKYCVCMWM